MALADKFGALTVDKQFDDMYSEWYIRQDISDFEDYRIASYLERRNKVHILKVAALMALGDNRMTLLPIDFERTLAVFNVTERKLRTAFLIAGGNRLAPHVLRLKAILESRGGKAPLRQLYSVVHTELDPTEFKMVVQTLIETEYAKVVTEGSTTYVVKI